MAAAVSQAVTETADTPADSATDDRSCNCQMCHSTDLPADKIGRAKTVHWVGCDGCPLWFHNVRVAKGNVKYTCEKCRN